MKKRTKNKQYPKIKHGKSDEDSSSHLSRFLNKPDDSRGRSREDCGRRGKAVVFIGLICGVRVFGESGDIYLPEYPHLLGGPAQLILQQTSTLNYLTQTQYTEFLLL
jgi:hypothetical protein